MRLDFARRSKLWLRHGFGRSRVRLYICCAVTFVAFVAGAAFGPLVRAHIASTASKRRLDVTVGSVRPAWFGVRLHDVALRLHDVAGVTVRIDDVRVELTLGLAVDRLELWGGQIALSGKADQLRDDFERWRGDRAARSDGPSGAPVIPISAEGISVRWTDVGSAEPRVDLSDVAVSRSSRGTQVRLANGRIRLNRASLSVASASADLDPKMMLVRSRIASVLAEWLPGAPASAPAQGVPADVAPAGGPAGSPIVATRTAPGRARASTSPPDTVPDPGAPFIALPDLRGLRRRAAALASQLATRTTEGAEVTVDALTWRIAQSSAERVALTFGPGPVSLARTASALELRYSTNASAKEHPDGDISSLSLRAVVPTDGSDIAITLEGGPVSLSHLGIQEGAAGLVDVSRATVTGRARVVLAGDGAALSFDADVGARALALSNPKLSSDTVRGLDVALRARGVASAGGEIRLDDFAATLGSLHLTGSGVLDQQPDFVTAAFRFEIPTATCQSLLSSVPGALLLALQGTEFGGTFGARGHFAFNSRVPDDLDLQYDIQDRCRMVHVPDDLAPDRFKQSFVHRIFLPDGSMADELTGPGTANWTTLDDISPYMQVAVLTTEDGAFPHHHGFNHAAIRSSIIANLKARRFVRGASTITMQLAKNLFLTREKTLSRKLEELVLTDYLEQTFTKGEILELYLNVIEFGPAVYGITAAAEYYFGRTPAELNLAECLFLSSLLPAPLRYSAMRDGEQPTEGWMRTLRFLMQTAHKTGLVTDAELAEGLEEPVAFWHGDERPPPRAPVHVHIHTGDGEVETVPPFDLPADSP